MKGNRRRDTRPEVELRRSLHADGIRFRKDFPIRLDGRRPVRADIAFTRQRLAVFVDGCFWHSCPEHGQVPMSNRHYWMPKLRRNAERDRHVDAALSTQGWEVIRVWEHIPPPEASDLVRQRLQELER
jgi:DNA mismatch endonuclease (patch repair protein)